MNTEHCVRAGDRIAAGVSLRHHHGSQFISHAFQDELRPVGIASSPSSVHAVWDRESGVTGIACFGPAPDLALDGCPVRLVSAPALVMAQPQVDGSLHLSVCDPALHLADGRSRPVRMDVKLDGSWSVGTGDGVEAEPVDCTLC